GIEYLAVNASVFIAYPTIMLTACRNHMFRYAGIYKPSSNAMPRWMNTGNSAGEWASGLAVVSPNTMDCTRPEIDANATPSASSSNGVAHGSSRMAVVTI